MYIQIKSLEELILHSTNPAGPMTEIVVQLNYGLRSSKAIIYYPKNRTFDIENFVDGTFDEDITEEQLMNETTIGEAIRKGALFLDPESR